MNLKSLRYSKSRRRDYPERVFSTRSTPLNCCIFNLSTSSVIIHNAFVCLFRLSSGLWLHSKTFPGLSHPTRNTRGRWRDLTAASHCSFPSCALSRLQRSAALCNPAQVVLPEWLSQEVISAWERAIMCLSVKLFVGPVHWLSLYIIKEWRRGLRSMKKQEHLSLVDVMPCYKFTNVSEEHSAPIFRVQE